nr:MAG TPA: hypothetical protein [Caudoviricetes sp.]
MYFLGLETSPVFLVSLGPNITVFLPLLPSSKPLA